MKRVVSSFLLSMVFMLCLAPAAFASTSSSTPNYLPYYIVGPISEGLAAYCDEEKCGFIDLNGKVVIQAKYDEVLTFSEGLAAVSLDGKWGYIDKTGKEIVKPQYDGVAYQFKDGFAQVMKNDKWGYVDKTGTEVIGLKYDDTNTFGEGLAHVKIDGKFGYIDTTGKMVIQPQFDSAGIFSGGIAPVKVDSKLGYIDKTGKMVVQPQYDNVYPVHEGLAGVEVDGKWGFIDTTGKVVIKPQFDFAYNFYEGLAAVQVNELWGFIDKTGNMAINPQFTDVLSVFTEGTSFVAKNDDKGYVKFGYIDKTGKEATEFDYDIYGTPFSDGYAVISDGGAFSYYFIKNPLTTSTPGNNNNSNNNDKPSSWAVSDVEAAKSLNLVPQDLQSKYTAYITRAEFCKLAVNLLTVKTGKTIDEILSERSLKINTSAFTDTQDATILAANALGIVSGNGDNKFDPNGLISRQEAAVMLSKTGKLLGVTTSGSSINFADSKDIASWAKESVNFVSAAEDLTDHSKIMNGTGNNKFSPLDKYTREQAFITMKKLYNAK